MPVPDTQTARMASKRLSKLKSSELEPSEKGLSDEDGLEFNLSGVLSMTTEDEIKKWESENKGLFMIDSIVSSIVLSKAKPV